MSQQDKKIFWSELKEANSITYVKLSTYLDVGVSRLRVYGQKSSEEE